MKESQREKKRKTKVMGINEKEHYSNEVQTVNIIFNRTVPYQKAIKERERESEKESFYAFIFVCVYVYLCKRERERVCVYICV